MKTSLTLKKLLAPCAVLIGFPSFSLGDVEVPEALSQLIADPPSISTGERHLLTSRKVGEDGVVIEGKEFICYLSVSAVKDADSNPVVSKSNYKYVTFLKKFDLVLRGKGEVFEKHVSVSKPSRRPKEVQLVDNGSQLNICFGSFTVLWSARDHLYLGENVRAVNGTEDDLWDKVEEFRGRDK